jgi:D-glycero-D-manno-heptose 1,7-bisphosphate phosphatase
MRRSAVFLDRDGVINGILLRNGVPCPPTSAQDLRILPGVADALSALKARGFVLVVVTNQSVESIHDRISRELSVDAILTCFHDDGDDCDCRKPRPGLLLRAARELDLDVASSFMVGDRWRDIEAGTRAGCRTFYIDGGYEERLPTSYDFRVGSLQEAAAMVVALLESR